MATVLFSQTVRAKRSMSSSGRQGTASVFRFSNKMHWLSTITVSALSAHGETGLGKPFLYGPCPAQHWSIWQSNSQNSLRHLDRYKLPTKIRWKRASSRMKKYLDHYYDSERHTIQADFNQYARPEKRAGYCLARLRPRLKNGMIFYQNPKFFGLCLTGLAIGFLAVFS